jgi:uncharacterized membrane protein YesL
MRFLSRLADLMILNILVLIPSIPVITIGAALTAMHYVLIKMVRNEETYITKMFFKSFKENFLQSTIEWIIIMAVFGVFAADYFIFVRSGQEFSTVFMIAILAVSVLVMMSIMYVFPLQARFYNTIGKTFKNSVLIMILNFPKSILMFILYMLPVVLLFISSFATPFLIMFGVSVPGLGAVYLYRKVFERFEPEAAQITDDMDFHVEVLDEDGNPVVDAGENAGKTGIDTDTETITDIDISDDPVINNDNIVDADNSNTVDSDADNAD